MEDFKLFDAEYKFMSLIWAHEPVGSGELVRLAGDALGWKKSTVYTVLRKLCDRGFLKNDDAVVTALISRAEAQRCESQAVLQKAFDDSLPAFVAAFLRDKALRPEEAEELRRMIEEATK